MLTQFCIVCTLCLSTCFVSANNAFFIGARRHKPRWQGHPLTITGGYAPYQEDYHPDLSPYKYVYRPYYYQSGQSEDENSEMYDYKEYPENSKAYFSDYYSEDTPPAPPEPLNDYQQALMRQNFIDFLIRQGPNMYKDHKKMKYMYQATNTYPKPLVGDADYSYNTFYQGTGINNYQSSYWQDKDETEERDHNNRTYVYGIPKYSESDEPAKTKPRVFTTQDLRKDNPFELNKEKNKVKVEEDVEVKELESQRSNLQDIISTYPLGSAGTAAIVDDPDDEYSPSSLGKSIKDLVSKDNMDENVQINDKPLWKQDDRSWISGLYKRAPSLLAAATSVASSFTSSGDTQSKSNIISENRSQVNPNEAPQPIATTVRTIEERQQEDKSEKTSSSSSDSSSSSSDSRTEKTHPRDVYETIKKLLNEEDKFHQHGGIDIAKKKRSYISTEDELAKELGALRKS